MKQKEVSASSRPLFLLGQIVATPNALRILTTHEIAPMTLLMRHQSGDWGELVAEDRHQNFFAVRAGLRILSNYQLGEGHRIWIITEADRSSTTILLPDEY